MHQQIDISGAALLTVDEVAAILRVKKKWVYDHADGRRQPKLPCYEIGSGGRKTRRFSPHQLDAFLRDCEKKWVNR